MTDQVRHYDLRARFEKAYILVLQACGSGLR